MKTLISKNKSKKTTNAQCCAKQSKTAVGCHD